MIVGIVAGILLLMLLVLLHEFGHFMAAKKSGVKVLEFGIGIPPKLFRLFKDKSGTEYTVNAIPLGGFVRLKGEDPNNPNDVKDKDSLLSVPYYKKLIIILGGIIMNILTAWVLFSIGFMHGVKPIQIMPDNISSAKISSYLMPTFDFLVKNNLISGDVQELKAEIGEVLTGELAANAGIQSGDYIASVDGYKVNSLNLTRTLKQYIGKEFNLVYVRNNKEFTTKITCPQDNCMLGVLINQGTGIDLLPVKFAFFPALAAGFREVQAETVLTFNALGNLGKNLFSFDRKKAGGAVKKMSGPVGAVKFGEMILNDLGIWAYLVFGGMISLALALFNVLPIPALDGGRLLGMTIQAIFKIKKEKYFVIENYINIIFFVALMLLGVYIILLDLQRAWGVNIPFL